MAVVMRLSRGGAKKRPYYRIVVADQRSPRDGKYLERIGSYNPLLPKDSEERVKLDTDRAKHWLEVGAVPSDRVSRFLDAAGLMKRQARNNPQKAEPGEKAKERAEERAAKETERKEAEEAAKTQAAEAPAETSAEAEPPAEAEQTAEPEVAPEEEKSAEAPAEGADDAAPEEGAEKAG